MIHKIGMTRLGSILAGAGLCLWAFASNTFRDAEGMLTGQFILPIAAAIALVTVVLLLTWSKTATSPWFAISIGLLILGQAAALQMIWAGRKIHYQHYLPLVELVKGEPVAIGVFFVQVLVVFWGLARYWNLLWKKILTNIRIFQILVIFAAIFFSSAAVSEDPKFYMQELLWATLVQVVNLATLILIGISTPVEFLSWFQRATSSLLGGDDSEITSTSKRPSRLVIICAAWVFMISALLNILSYQSHPHVPDEVAYLMHARFLADGALTLPAPPVEEAFEFYLMQFAGERWYPATPFGWPAMLALGELIGMPWLVNPLLAGINIFLVYWIVRDLYSSKMAGWTILLLSLSPWYIFMAMNYMTHTFSLFCALLATWGVMRSRKTGRVWWTGVGGAAIGILSLIRPLEGVVMAVLLGVWAIGIGGKRLRFISIITLIVVTGLVASLNLFYNRALTGDATVFPLNAYTDQVYGVNSNAYGFGPDRGMGWGLDPNPGHSPIDGLINASLNTFMVNTELSGWSTGSIWLLAAFILFGSYKKNDTLMLAVLISIFGVMFFYYYSGGPDFGARYWYLMIVPLVVLSLRGVQALTERFKINSVEGNLFNNRVFVGIAILSLTALVTFIPWRALDKYYQYLNMRPDVARLAGEIPFDSALVLVRGEYHPDYASAATYNPLDLNQLTPIYAYDIDGPTRSQVLQAYIDRDVWFVDGPTLTGNGYRVIAGPLRPADLLSGKVNIP